MKHKLSLIDIYKLVPPLKKHCVGKRVSTVHSLSNKTIIIKLSDKSKIMIDIGNKMYLTNYDVPNINKVHQIQSVLRSHLLNRIVMDIRQLNLDRVVLIEFNLDYKLKVDLYGSGNLIFTKGDETIFEILKDVKNADFKEKLDLNLIKEKNVIEPLFLQKQPSKTTFSKFLMNYDYGKDLNNHLLSQVAELEQNFDIIQSLNAKILSSNENKGYIYYSKWSNMLLIDDIHTVTPIKLNLPNYIEKEFETFSAALDTYFNEVEQAKLFQKQQAQTVALNKKIKDIQNDQQRRMGELNKEILSYQNSAELIQEHSLLVSRILELVNNALATGMGWEKVEQVLEMDKIRFPELQHLEKVFFDKSEVSVFLDNELSRTLVKLKLDLTDFGNVQHFHDKRKHQTEKLLRTEQAYQKSLKSIQKSIDKEQNKIEKFYVDQQIIKKRTVYWFEKFHWFITSDGYLAIGGRDAHQNELLVKRYMKEGDLYLHADINGSPSTVLKGKPGGIPERSLAEAGAFTVCLSKAWDSKIVTSAYYVFPSQVSLTAPTGEYLKTGSFMIRGKKNFLPPIQLVLGFGVLFKTNKESAISHVKEPVEQNYIDSFKKLELAANEKPENIFAQSMVDQIEQNPILTQIIESTKARPADLMNKDLKEKRPQKQNATSNRTKKRQANKKSRKYKDQDEEEREIAISILEGRKLEKNDGKITENEITPTRPVEKLFIPTKTQDQYDEDKIKDAELEMNQFRDIDLLISDVLPDDYLEFAVPVCAPYEAMKTFKFKVKLTPGTEKKGKSAKTSLNLFLSQKELGSQEKELIQILSVDEIIRTIPNKCKVSAPNLEALKSKNKKQKKKKK
eukprot:NODE_132_length_16614_cov_0.935392.p2 type:complete len:846 gc:universal NODE_132_length_16614_cov_0.935392:3794-1257(-)